MKYVLYLIISLGLIITTYAVWEISQTNMKADESLKEAKKVVAQDIPLMPGDYNPSQGDVVGLLKIPDIDASLAIVEGTNPDDLEKGVGHYKGSYYPEESGQIVLSGHRDTVFKRMGELQLGDDLNIEMPYGDFSYKIIDTKIVDADDTSIITLQNEKEELILTTCYPFGFIGNAPHRYIIYAEINE